MRCWGRYFLGVAGAALALLPVTHALAQQQSQSATVGPVRPISQAAPVQKLAQARPKGAAAAKASSEAGGSAGSGSDAQLRQRVEYLEQQFLDMQVMVGTLESLARNTGTAAPSMRSAPALGSGSDAGRIDALETQVRALTAQIEQLSGQTRRSDSGIPPSVQREPLPTTASTSVNLAPSPEIGFGSTVVTPGGGDAIGRFLNEGAASDDTPQLSFATPGLGGGDPKQVYETAYGYLLQQNYAAAESAFEDFLSHYPNDALAGNAQYWLGESLYVRGQFKAAAGAFLKGYQTYGKSAKAPDSLLKLAMSLDRLGQKDAACSSFAELSSRFPSAPSHVRTRAQTERQRVGC